MNYVEYVNAVNAVKTRLIPRFLAIFLPWIGRPLSAPQYRALVTAAYPIVEEARTEVSELARQFYDSERERVIGALNATGVFPQPVEPVDLAHYEPSWLAEALQPVEKKVTKGTPVSLKLVSRATSEAVKEVENGGRKTIRDGVKGRHGWARVAGGGSSCGFCAMLISRGPVYESAKSAGLKLDDTQAYEILDRIEDPNDDLGNGSLDDLVNRWHANCDCKIVPVFDEGNWTGRDEYLEAEEIWKDFRRKNPELVGKEVIYGFDEWIDNNAFPSPFRNRKTVAA